MSFGAVTILPDLNECATQTCATVRSCSKIPIHKSKEQGCWPSNEPLLEQLSEYWNLRLGNNKYSWDVPKQHAPRRLWTLNSRN